MPWEQSPGILHPITENSVNTHTRPQNTSSPKRDQSKDLGVQSGHCRTQRIQDSWGQNSVSSGKLCQVLALEKFRGSMGCVLLSRGLQGSYVFWEGSVWVEGLGKGNKL